MIDSPVNHSQLFVTIQIGMVLVPGALAAHPKALAGLFVCCPWLLELEWHAYHKP